jgi:RNA recognition motif-containing protein
MAQKLFVAGLSFNTTNEGLGAYFGRSGTVVSANIVTDQFSGRSRGFGFVEMQTPEEATHAVTTLNGSELDGRTLKVEIARPKVDSRRDGARGGYDKSGSRGGWR